MGGSYGIPLMHDLKASVLLRKLACRGFYAEKATEDPWKKLIPKSMSSSFKTSMEPEQEGCLDSDSGDRWCDGNRLWLDQVFFFYLSVKFTKKRGITNCFLSKTSAYQRATKNIREMSAAQIREAGRAGIGLGVEPFGQCFNHFLANIHFTQRECFCQNVMNIW